MLGGTADSLASADFYRPAHQLIYEAVEALRGGGKPAEPIAVADELRRRGELSRVGGGPYLHTCLQAVPSSAQAGYYAAIVRELADRRKLIEHADRLRQHASNPAADIADVRDLAARAAVAGGGSADCPGPQARSHPRHRGDRAGTRHWAWEDDGDGRIPAGSLGLFAGREGTGKCSFLVWQSAKITRGSCRARSSARRAVIYVAVEDSWKFTIVPRLMAAGADRDLVYRAEVRRRGRRDVSLTCPPITPARGGHHRNGRRDGRARPAAVSDQRHPRHARQPAGPQGPGPARRLADGPVPCSRASPTSTSQPGH